MIDLLFINVLLGHKGVNKMSQNEETLYNQRLTQIRRDYETRRWMRLVVTSIGIIVSFLALISLMGIVTHSAWVNMPIASISSVFYNLTLDIFVSGLKGLAIFSGIAISLWGLRTRI
jgi:hypothetical protein